jgi:hypothetical protein
MAGYIDPSDPIVRGARRKRAVRMAADALAPILDAAVAAGLTREEVAEVAGVAIEDGRPGVPERIRAALAEEIERS